MYEAFLICPDLIEAVELNPNAPNLPKGFWFCPKLEWSFSIGPNLMNAVGITTRFQFTSRQCLFSQQRQKRSLKGSDSFAIRGKKEWQNSLRKAFAIDGKINTTPLDCECSHIICPNDENIFPNNGLFASVGDETASLASPCRTLTVTIVTILQEMRLNVKVTFYSYASP